MSRIYIANTKLDWEIYFPKVTCYIWGISLIRFIVVFQISMPVLIADLFSKMCNGSELQRLFSEVNYHSSYRYA